MAVPTVVGVGTVVSGTGAITPGLPSGWQENDIFLLICETSGDETITCSGYTQLCAYGTNSANGSRITVLWKRAGSSESDPTTSDSGDHQLGAIMAVRGCIETSSPFVSYWTGDTGSGSTKTWTPNFNTYITDTLVVAGLASMTDGFTDSAFSSWSNTSLTSVTEQIDQYTDVGNGGGLGVVTGTKATAGPLGTFQVTDGHPSSGVGAAAFVTAMISKDVARPFVRGRGAYNQLGSTAGYTANIPLVTPQDDIVMVFVETANESVTVTGYTEAPSSPASNAGTNPTRLTAFWKRAGASESGAAISDSGLHQIAGVLTIGGAVITGDPFDATTSDTGGTGSTVSIPGTTTSTGGTLVVTAAASTRDVNNLPNVTFSSWTNTNLTNFNEIIDLECALGISPPNGGAVGVAAGNYAGPGNYGTTTVTQASAVEYAGWSGALKKQTVNITLSADSGTLTMAGADAAMSWFAAEAGSLTAAGENATFRKGYSLTADAAVYGLTGQLAAGIFGYGMFADYGAISLTQSASTFDQCMKADSSPVTLAEGRYQITAGNPAVSTLTFLIDLVPSTPSGGYQRYTERLTVGGTEVPLISWQYAENPGAIGGKLEFEIADVSKRDLFFSGVPVVFEVGVWDGSQYVWTSLLDTGILKNSRYGVQATARGARETVTVSAASEMEDRLNTAADANIHMVDPDNAPGYSSSSVNWAAERTAAISSWSPNLPAVIKLNGQSVPAKEIQLTAMGLHALLSRIFVTECGFSQVVTNLPDFRVTSFDCRAGEPYINAIGGLIGMYEPVFSVFKSNGSLVLVISDGTTGELPSVGGGRTVNVSGATVLALESEFVKNLTGAKSGEGEPTDGDGEGQFVGWLDLTFNDKGTTRDWQNSVERVVTESVKTGTIGEDGNQWTRQDFTKTYLDFYDSRYGDLPVKSELKTISASSSMRAKRTTLEGKQYYDESVVETSFEKFIYEYGELSDRYKWTNGKIAMGRTPTSGNYTADDYILIANDRYEAFELRPVFLESERITREWHPYIPGRLYISSREVVIDGLLVVDSQNGQTGQPYIRAALESSRAGNLVDGQKLDWGRISSVFERFTPNGDGTVSVTKVEHDYLANQISYDESRVDDGQIGYNARSGAQRNVAVTPEGADEAWGLDKLLGAGVPFNAGQLPLNLGVAVGKRFLRNLRRVKKTYSLDIIGIDPYLQQGMLISAYGPSNEHLGGFTVESRTLSGGPAGYTMSIQARTATA